MSSLLHRTVEVDGVRVFYREAGPRDTPALLLLHGFPTAGHMFRDLIPRLADRFRLVAPDLPGFGQTGLLPAGQKHGFARLAEVAGLFSDAVGLERFGLYVFDYGAPVGFRMAMARPERVTAIVSQNGNAYEDGLSGGWDPIRRYWEAPTDRNRDALRSLLALDSIRWQYTHGVSDEELVSPDGYTLDHHYLQRRGADEAQLDLFLDYASNVALYPEFQRYLREHRPKLLAIWGRNDPFFLPAGAEAYRRDVPGADVRFLETGHFALETHAGEIAAAIRSFMG